ncbi:hypothetical protein E5K00_02640 [Hymenobacter aquaticus]|uniref:Uncharacterized protein n=1 Tax=Hymenobacter aquaticus TaxID=1867101 RepID=A0A4Z0Q295_9BACT|nr:hypothetical protein [Hymenobacter aquaticus]TGE24130.1 hypothetical protein E5K00_02640 [Hymenobacter aquaticus]
MLFDDKLHILFEYKIIHNKLYMVTSCGKENILCINLQYLPSSEEWDANKSIFNWNSNYYYSIQMFEEYIIKEFALLPNTISAYKSLMDQILLICFNGIASIVEFVFNDYNKNNGVPAYNDFVKAFEIYSGACNENYEVKALDSIVIFKLKNESFEINTYESMKQYLKSYIEGESYDEIYTETEMRIWSEIYLDPGIEKEYFIPKMLNEWEIYWSTLYSSVRERVGSTSHLDGRKEASLRKLNMYFDLYKESNDVIRLAWDFDDMVLYPIAVITMVNIFDSDVCYDEYCELEFFTGGKWESISLNEEDPSALIFFIRREDI